MTPYITEDNKVYDIYSRLLQDRIILISGQITNDMAATVVSQLLYLSSINTEDITIYINTPGGSVSDGLAIYDVIQHIQKKCDVSTVCIGMAASMGSILLCCGTEGKRKIMPHGKIMIHQASASIDGKCTDLVSSAKDIEHTEEVLTDILAKHSKMTKTVLKKRMMTDTWYTADQAQKVGLVDEVIK